MTEEVLKSPTEFKPVDAHIQHQRAKLVEQHKLWLDDPITQLALTAIAQREKKYDNDLVAGIRIASDEKKEIQLRACINTVQSLFQILSNSEIFALQTIKSK